MNFPPLVMDSSCLINLHNGGVLKSVFKLPFEFITTDFIYHEIRLDWGKLVCLGLRINHFSGKQVNEIYLITQQAGKGLTAQDVSVFYLAKENQWMLLCDDGALRKYATAKHVMVHGSIWVLDQLIIGNLVTRIEAASCLDIMRVKGAHFSDNLFNQTIIRWTNK